MPWNFNLREFSSRPRSRFDRVLAITLGTGVALLLILGLVFSIAHSSQQITTRATGLHNADETLRSATVVRAQLGLANHMVSVDQSFGTNSSDAIELSLSEARAALGDIRTGMSQLEDDELLPDEAVRAEVDRFEATARELITLVEVGDVASAQQLSPNLDAEFQSLVSELEGVRDALRESVESSDEFLGRIGDVTRFLVAFLIPAAVIFIYRELLLRQHRQFELERRLESERQLSKSREEFIANASHELRTPLTGIAGLAHILAEEPAIQESETASELLGLIIAESGDLSRMVEDLLTTARLDAGALHFTFEDVHMERIVSDVVDPMVRSGDNIALDCDPGLVRADKLRLRQVLRNLVSNAKKYGGPNVEVRGRVEGRTYVCSVLDDGPGIPEEVSDRLFERFVHNGRTAVKDSVGLGLAIVQALVHGMGGSVVHRREQGKTAFIVRLNLVDEADSYESLDLPFEEFSLSDPSVDGAPLMPEETSQPRSGT